MRITIKECKIISLYDGKACIDIDVTDMSFEERNKVFVLEFPKRLKDYYSGKIFEVEEVKFNNLHSTASVTFPRLKKVRCPKDTLDSYCRWSLEDKAIVIEEY